MPVIRQRDDWMLHEPDFFVESVLRNHPGTVTFFCIKDYGEGPRRTTTRTWRT